MTARSQDNVAARAERRSAEQWMTAVAVGVVLEAAVGMHRPAPVEQAARETARAAQDLSGAGFDTPASESVLTHT
jgi:hypothetical protein